MTNEEAKNVLTTMRISVEMNATPIITNKELCEALDLAIKALEQTEIWNATTKDRQIIAPKGTFQKIWEDEQHPCEGKQDCEHCIHTYGTLGCCDVVNNEWIYDCDFGREQYRKEHEKPCEGCFTDEEKRIFLASVAREMRVCEQIDSEKTKVKLVPILERVKDKVLRSSLWKEVEE